MHRRTLLRAVATTTAVLIATSSGASASAPRRQEVRTVDAAGSAKGVGILQRLAADPNIPSEASEGLQDALAEAAGERISVTTPLPAVVAGAASQPRWSAVRSISVVNDFTLVVDRSIDFERIGAQVIPPDGSTPLTLDVRLGPDPEDPTHWLVEWRANNGEPEVVRYAGRRPNQCLSHCVTAGLAASLIAGLFCLIAIPVGWMAGALVCVALAAVITADVAVVCDSVTQVCDDDPNRTLFFVPPPEMECAQTWNSCDVKGVFSAHLRNTTVTAFSAWLSFWFNPTEYGFNTFSAADLNLRQTVNNSAQVVWRYDGWLYSPIPNAECTTTATLQVFITFGTAGSAYVETGRPKAHRPESNCRL